MKSFIQSMIIYPITTYSFHTSLIKDIEKWINNVVWYGDIEHKKLVIVAWKKNFVDLSNNRAWELGISQH